jgi:hypothetical protein
VDAPGGAGVIWPSAHFVVVLVLAVRSTAKQAVICQGLQDSCGFLQVHLAQFFYQHRACLSVGCAGDVVTLAQNVA